MPSDSSSLNVFHGISGAAGQPASTVNALRKLGVNAKNYVVGDNLYNFSHDRKIEVHNDLNSTMLDMIGSELLEFNVFHLYFRPLLLNKKNTHYPTGLDLVLLRLLGKRVVFNFRGSEVRFHSKFKELSPFNYVDENPDGLTEKFPEDMQRNLVRLVAAVCDQVLVPDPELQSYVPMATVVPRSIDLEQWVPAPMADKDKPLVVHAPSRQEVKGSRHVIRAVEELRAQGLQFDFQLVEGMTNEEARAVYQKADIIVDQLRIGWYGVLAAEGMALNKAVVSYIRKDLEHHLGDNPPLANANPETIKPVLAQLISDRPYRQALANRGLEYCQEVHDAKKVAASLIEIYQQPSRPIDATELTQFLAEQHQHQLQESAQLQALDIAQKRQLRILERKLAQKTEHLESIQRKLAPFIRLRNLLLRRKGS